MTFIFNFLYPETKKITKKIQKKLTHLPTMQPHPQHFFVPTLVPTESGIIKNTLSIACCLFPSIVRLALSGLRLSKAEDGASSCNHDFYSQARENASLSSLVCFFF